MEGGDNQVPDVAGGCPGGIALDASNGNIFCYGVQRDAVPLVTNTGGSLTVENGENNVVDQVDFDTWWGLSFANCPGDIDFDVINDVITCYDVDSVAANGRGDALVKNTDGDVSAAITVNNAPGGASFANCPGGIVFDRMQDKLFCYGIDASSERDAVTGQSDNFESGSGSITVTASGTNNPTDGFFAICPGDIDLAINGDITCFLDEAGDSGTALVKNTGSGFITVTGGTNTPDETITPSSCPGGITLDKSEDPLEIFCYNVARNPVPLETNVAVSGDSGSIVVTETSEEDVASQEKTTIAGGTINNSATITVTGGDALASEGTNYKIELNTDNGDFEETVTVDDGAGTVDVTVTQTPLDGTSVGPDTTRTVTEGTGTDTVTVTVTKVPDDGSVTKTVTVSDNGVPQSRTTTVTASDANDDEKIVDVTVTVTEETPLGTVTAKDTTQTVTTTTSEDANGVKTDTVTTVVTTTDVVPGTDSAAETNTKEVTETVTAPNAAIAGLLSGIKAPDDTFPDSFAENTVITIVSKSADDSAGGALTLKTVDVKTELNAAGTTTVTDYNIDYSESVEGILGFIKEIKTEEESVTTTFFLTGDDSLPNPDGGEEDVTAGKYLDLFEESVSEISTVLRLPFYRNRLPAGGKLPASFKDQDKIKDEAILKFEIEGTSEDALFDDPSRLALTANLTTPVSGETSRKLLQEGVVAETETEFRSQIDDDDNIEESLKKVEKDAGGNVIRFSANETKIEVGETGVVTVTEIETVNGDTLDQVVTVNELVLTEIGGRIISEKITVNGQVDFCEPATATVCGGSGPAPAPSPGSPDNGGGGGGGSPTPVPGSPDTDPDVPVPDPDVPVPDPDVPGGGGETPAPPAPPAVSCAVSGRKKKRQCNQKPAGKCIFQKKGKRCLALPANGGLCTAFTRRKVCRRAGSPSVWTGGRKRGSCGPAQ